MESIFKPLKTVLAGILTVAVLTPAFIPEEGFAEKARGSKKRIERRVKAKERSAARLLKRIITSNEYSAEEKETAMRVAVARCQEAAAGFRCGDGKGGNITITTATNCRKCQGGQGNSQCLACCDALSGANSNKCKLANC